MRLKETAYRRNRSVSRSINAALRNLTRTLLKASGLTKKIYATSSTWTSITKYSSQKKNESITFCKIDPNAYSNLSLNF